MDSLKPLLLSAGAIATLWGGFIDGLADAAIPANEHEMGKALAAFVLMLAPVGIQWAFKRLLTWGRTRFGPPEVEAIEVLRDMIQSEVAHAQAGHLAPSTSSNVQPSIPSLDGPSPASL
ncbi:MAG: hypothetical protein ACRYFX_12675 [Janthinobacterium lividum]